MTASHPRLVEALRKVAEAQFRAVEVAQVANLWPDAIGKHDKGAVARELTCGWDEVGSHVGAAASWLIAQSAAIGLSGRVIDLMASVLLQTLSAPARGVDVAAEGAVTAPDIPAEPDVWLKHALRTRPSWFSAWDRWLGPEA